MPDREKVIKGLECCKAKNIDHDYDACDRCPYNGRTGGKGCYILYADALTMLKEQEAEIRQLRLALDIAKGTCNGIKVKGR